MVPIAPSCCTAVQAVVEVVGPVHEEDRLSGRCRPDPRRRSSKAHCDLTRFRLLSRPAARGRLQLQTFSAVKLRQSCGLRARHAGQTSRNPQQRRIGQMGGKGRPPAAQALMQGSAIVSCAIKLVHDVSKHHKPKQPHWTARFEKLPSPCKSNSRACTRRHPSTDEMLHRGNQPSEERTAS